MEKREIGEEKGRGRESARWGRMRQLGFKIWILERSERELLGRERERKGRGEEIEWEATLYMV
jgi:hypothetical protein